ncbi:MAG TPA: hypothetical protein VFQ87_00770 [Bradyrhizobium sp.]|nr:hypothetical protein [Bradyrhizobium sp.]
MDDEAGSRAEADAALLVLLADFFGAAFLAAFFAVFFGAFFAVFFAAFDFFADFFAVFALLADFFFAATAFLPFLPFAFFAFLALAIGGPPVAADPVSIRRFKSSRA